MGRMGGGDGDLEYPLVAKRFLWSLMNLGTTPCRKSCCLKAGEIDCIFSMIAGKGGERWLYCGVGESV